MSRRVTMRICAPPLLPQHLVAALAKIDGMGFGADETQSFDKSYHAVALEACEEEISRSKSFNEAIAGKVLKDIGRPIAKLSPSNQFLAMAPSIEICDLTPENEVALEHLLNTPFVLTFRNIGTLERARRTDADPLISQSKLAGFIEHYIGCSAALFYDRTAPTQFQWTKDPV